MGSSRESFPQTESRQAAGRTWREQATETPQAENNSWRPAAQRLLSAGRWFLFRDSCDGSHLLVVRVYLLCIHVFKETVFFSGPRTSFLFSDPRTILLLPLSLHARPLLSSAAARSLSPHALVSSVAGVQRAFSARRCRRHAVTAAVCLLPASLSRSPFLSTAAPSFSRSPFLRRSVSLSLFNLSLAIPPPLCLSLARHSSPPPHHSFSCPPFSAPDLLYDLAGGALPSKMDARQATSAPQCMQPSPISSPTGNHNELSPFEMLVQGFEQTIHIPLKTILVEVMKAMPAKAAPNFKITNLGDSGFQASVELNVSGSRVTVEPKAGSVNFDGEISAQAELSMLSAVKIAFDYLEKKHFVQVIDYSSSIVEGYDCKFVLGRLNSVCYILEKVLADWVVVVDKLGMYQVALESNELVETTDDGVRSAAAVIYAEAKDSVDSLYSNYKAKHKAMLLQFMAIQGKRSKHINDSSDKVNKHRMKAYRQFLKFNDTHALSFVLEFLGLEQAEFSNKPVGDGEFCGEVIIHLPRVEEARCGGRTRFRGGNRSSAAEAEEDAAFKALRYMETNLKLTIADLNYTERVEAEGNHKFMVKLLRSIVGLARTVLDEWSKMNENINDEVYIYGGISPGTSNLSDAQVAALNFCKDGFAKIQDDCNTAYQDAMSKLSCLDKYKPSDDDSYN